MYENTIIISEKFLTPKKTYIQIIREIDLKSLKVHKIVDIRVNCMIFTGIGPF